MIVKDTTKMPQDRRGFTDSLYKLALPQSNLSHPKENWLLEMASTLHWFLRKPSVQAVLPLTF